jgi:hypothetical protein
MASIGIRHEGRMPVLLTLYVLMVDLTAGQPAANSRYFSSSWRSPPIKSMPNPLEGVVAAICALSTRETRTYRTEKAKYGTYSRYTVIYFSVLSSLKQH